ncbi:hypothetical protein HTS88_15675 [Pseudarthrobacter oxydans]|uniref:hypothetical protein n=1 Tax=Pseudarthrobacter oxydans TaxID=1671 RepID=UPI00157305E1|nr:hypothetical protein [Pseudarthrobacter oxydans]NSX37823.1 hypothetical protein [Pseudarthrobacter oxydans]
MTISAPEYTAAPKTASPYAGGHVTYVLVPPHTTSKFLVSPAESHDAESAHMHSYLSNLWAQDWDNPEDSVYDEW